MRGQNWMLEEIFAVFFCDILTLSCPSKHLFKLSILQAIKFIYSEKAQKCWRNLPISFDITKFVVFSENQNFNDSSTTNFLNLYKFWILKLHKCARCTTAYLAVFLHLLELLNFFSKLTRS